MDTSIKGLAIAGLMLSSVAATAQDDKPFDGFFVGAEGGYLVGEGDVDGLAGNFFGGYRKQLDNNLVVGVEGTFGTADVDFLDHIWTVNGTVGWVVGNDNDALFSIGAGYAEAKASGFGFSSMGSGFSGLASYEKALGDTWSFRVKTTTLDFESFIGTVGLAARF